MSVEDPDDTAPALVRGRFAVVLTHNRAELLDGCVRAIAPQVDKVLVIDNASDPPAQAPAGLDNVTVVYDGRQPPNLAALWNLGLDTIAEHLPEGVDGWDVAMLCDDVAVPDGWYDTVVAAMRVSGASAGCTHSITPTGTPILKVAPDSDIYNRMTGWAFILDGGSGIRADESMHWWYCDTSADFSSRLAGGMVIAPGPVAVNLHPNDFTYTVPGLAEQAGRDREAFAVRWGFVPW